ncbi:hypothetical protein BH10ACI2_BH10ACI2_07360 [soil metagenome]
MKIRAFFQVQRRIGTQDFLSENGMGSPFPSLKKIFWMLRVWAAWT